MGVCVSNFSVVGRGDRRVPGTHWPSSIAELVSSRFNEADSKSKVGSDGGQHPLTFWPPHMHTYAHAHHLPPNIHEHTTTIHTCLQYTHQAPEALVIPASVASRSTHRWVSKL